MRYLSFRPNLMKVNRRLRMKMPCIQKRIGLQQNFFKEETKNGRMNRLIGKRQKWYQGIFSQAGNFKGRK
jgi:hypothetical protein